MFIYPKMGHYNTINTIHTRDTNSLHKKKDRYYTEKRTKVI